MKIILVMVTSLDGKSTKGQISPLHWASEADQKHFKTTLSQNNLIVMGKNTFLKDKNNIKPASDKLRIVMTKNPKQFAKTAVANQLEFSSENPKQLINRLSKLGYKQMLLVSGANLNSAFFKNNLVNEVWLTIEPAIFGEGKGIIEGKLDIKLQLRSCKKINSKGTLLLKYQVI